jgi:hypothetical protein
MSSPQRHHTIEEIIDYLCFLKGQVSYGTTELIWQDRNIVVVQHLNSYKPGFLPGVAHRTT